ncbi:MAG TPA: hypothetical protein VG759_21085 [Candidatus Angelobacter sp.]|jgi:hypothetical protein|nr:hypothetical protein [Candidatus Angelobacter sp.]
MKVTRLLVLSLGVALAISGAVPLLMRTFADSKPGIEVNFDNAGPREVEDTTQKAIVRDYSSAWQAVATALANNDIAPLRQNFVGFALDQFTQRVKDQQSSGLKTRIIDHGHKVDAIFYSKDGSAMQLRDTASIETQMLEGNTVIHSDQSQIQYYAIMTSTEDRWKLRVLESVPVK